MRRMAGVVVFSLVLASQLFAAGRAEEEQGRPVQIVMWHQWNLPAYVEFFDSVLEEYNAAQNDIEISHVAFPFEEYAATKLSTAFAAGAGPDIFETSPGFISQYIDAELVLPLNRYISEEAYNDFVPHAFDDATRDGVIYGIPFTGDVVGLYYDVDVLAAAGVTPPATWQELLSAAVQLNTPSRAGYTFDLTQGAWQNFTFFPFVWQQPGGELFVDGKANLDSEQVVKALQFWRDLLDSGGVSEKPSRPVPDISIIGDGETAMQINGSWSIPILETNYPDRKIGVVPLPVPEGGHYASVMGGWRWMINKDGKAPEDAAEFLKWCWLSDPPTRNIEFCTGLQFFTYSPRKSAIEIASETYGLGLRSVFSHEIFETARPEIAMPAEAAGIVQDMIQDALYNMSPPEAANKAQRRMTEFLQGYNGRVGL